MAAQTFAGALFGAEDYTFTGMKSASALARPLRRCFPGLPAGELSYTSADWTVILKVASIALLAVLGFRVNRLLGIALSFGALGDFLLGVHRLGPLMPTNSSCSGWERFWPGTLVYIAMFRRFLPRNWARHSPLRELGIMAVLLTLWLVLASLQSLAGPAAGACDRLCAGAGCDG